MSETRLYENRPYTGLARWIFPSYPAKRGICIDAAVST